MDLPAQQSEWQLPTVGIVDTAVMEDTEVMVATEVMEAMEAMAVTGATAGGNSTRIPSPVLFEAHELPSQLDAGS